jgi:hypothetical protein
MVGITTVFMGLQWFSLGTYVAMANLINLEANLQTYQPSMEIIQSLDGEKDITGNHDKGTLW